MVEGILSLLAGWLPVGPTGLNGAVYHLFNGLAGRSWALDSLASLVTLNHLLKAGVIGACFFAAWQTAERASDRGAVKILILTLLASVLVLAATKVISRRVLIPRPYVLSLRAYHLEGDRLVPYERVGYRIPTDDEGRRIRRHLREADIPSSDFSSFPSDHAGFFTTLALGVFLASRGAGLVALAWTLFGILAGKLITGMHTPVDVVAGILFAATGLWACQRAAAVRPFGRAVDRLAQWTLKHPSVASALLFVVLFEMCNSFSNARSLARFATACLGGIPGSW